MSISNTMHSAQGRIAHHVTNESTTLIDCLQKHFKLQPAEAHALLNLGAIYSDRRRVVTNRQLPKGTYLRLHLKPKRFPVAAITGKRYWCTKARILSSSISPREFPFMLR